jgi:hypothetical protein
MLMGVSVALTMTTMQPLATEHLLSAIQMASAHRSQHLLALTYKITTSDAGSGQQMNY